MPSSTFIPPKAPIRKGAAAQRYPIIYCSRTIIFADISEFVQIVSIRLSMHFYTVLKRRFNSNWCTINSFTAEIQSSWIARSHRTIRSSGHHLSVHTDSSQQRFIRVVCSLGPNPNPVLTRKESAALIICAPNPLKRSCGGAGGPQDVDRIRGKLANFISVNLGANVS